MWLCRTINSNQGLALVVAVMVMALFLSMTGAGLLFSGLDLKTTSHHKTATMAFFAAEAGLQHAWRESENGDGVNEFDAIHASPVGTLIVSNTSFSGASYTVTLLQSLDNPRRIRITSLGSAPNNSQARLEVWLRRDLGTAPKALITNGDLKINGNPKFVGARGGAHTNEDMRVDGNPGVQMVDGLTASNRTTTDGGLANGMDITGVPCIGSAACASNPVPDEYKLDTNEEKDAYEASHNSAPTYPIPEINPAHYASAVAENSGGYILKADCTVVAGASATFSNGLHTGGGTVVSAPSGWSCSGGTWRVSGNSAASGIFYGEGRVEVSGNPGSSSSPWQATIIARDSIKISGNPSIVPFANSPESLQNMLILTGNDLEISGNPLVTGTPGGVWTGGGIFAHQQVKISGNPEITGFIIAGDGQPTWPGDPFPDGPPGVTINEVSGNPTITYNGEAAALLPPTVTQIGWYQAF